MPTITIDLTPDELAELQSATGLSDPTGAAHAATLEFLRFTRRTRLKVLARKITTDANWPALEAAEMKDNNAR
jgi:hypothetical protein